MNQIDLENGELWRGSLAQDEFRQVQGPGHRRFGSPWSLCFSVFNENQIYVDRGLKRGVTLRSFKLSTFIVAAVEMGSTVLRTD